MASKKITLLALVLAYFLTVVMSVVGLKINNVVFFSVLLIWMCLPAVVAVILAFKFDFFSNVNKVLGVIILLNAYLYYEVMVVNPDPQGGLVFFVMPILDFFIGSLLFGLLQFLYRVINRN